jgi:hypothetical protein
MALAAAHYAAGRFTEAVGYGRQAVQQRQVLQAVTEFTWPA